MEEDGRRTCIYAIVILSSIDFYYFKVGSLRATCQPIRTRTVSFLAPCIFQVNSRSTHLEKIMMLSYCGVKSISRARRSRSDESSRSNLTNPAQNRVFLVQKYRRPDVVEIYSRSCVILVCLSLRRLRSFKHLPDWYLREGDTYLDFLVGFGCNPVSWAACSVGFRGT